MEETKKDTAIATAYFSSLLEQHSSFFNSIDKAYDMAVSFVEKYPPDTVWGIDTEYEETLYEFYKKSYDRFQQRSSITFYP